VARIEFTLKAMELAAPIGQLERQPTGVAHQPCPDLDELDWAAPGYRSSASF